MKRSFTAILLVLAAALTACGSPSNETGDTTDPGAVAATPEEAAQAGCQFANRCVEGASGSNFATECEMMMMDWLDGMSDADRAACSEEIVDMLATNPPCSMSGQSPPSCPGAPNTGK